MLVGLKVRAALLPFQPVRRVAEPPVAPPTRLPPARSEGVTEPVLTSRERVCFRVDERTRQFGPFRCRETGPKTISGPIFDKGSDWCAILASMLVCM